MFYEIKDMNQCGHVPSHSECIYVYCVYTDEVESMDLLETYTSLLHDWEKEKVSRYYFKKDRKTSLLSRALLKMILSGHANLSISEIDFQINKYGRPELKKNIDKKPVRFNLSHTDGLIVLAVTYGYDIGVDVESFKRKKNNISIARRFFSQPEVLTLQDKPESLWNECFYDFWTLKESYIKARGMGLSIPLNQFSFTLNSSEIKIEFQDGIDDHPEKWYFYLSEIIKDHKIAVAVKNGGLKHDILYYKCIPFSSIALLKT